MKKKWGVFTLLAVLAIGVMGCGNARSAMLNGDATASVTTESACEADMGFQSSTGVRVDEQTAQGALQTERKLIKTVDMTVETKEFDALLPAVESKVDELGGYMENMETYYGSIYSSYRSERNASMTLRIPKERLDEFLDSLSAISNVVRHIESVEDVTLQYVDLESHKQVLMTEQERVLELMEQALSMEDIITLEARLSEIRYQLESMESQLRTYDNKVTYSTVSLYIEEVRDLTVKEESIWQRMTGGFAETLRDIAHDAAEAAVWFVVNIPYLLIWAAVLGIAVLILKKIKKRTLRIKAQETAGAEENEGQGKNEK